MKSNLRDWAEPNQVCPQFGSDAIAEGFEADRRFQDARIDSAGRLNPPSVAEK